MSQKDNLFVFAEDDTPDETEAPLTPWNLLVVDDDTEVHSVTRLALANFQFAGRPLEIHSAHSAKEAKDLMNSGTEFVMALVDVVMESDQAGLDLVKWIRDDFGDDRIRLILRTGQAGNLPQRSIIENYDINDYKEKTDLTANKLFAMLYSSLRAYRDISLLEHKKNGLEYIIKANHDLFLQDSTVGFAKQILRCLKSLLNDSRSPEKACTGAFVVHEKDDGTQEVIASSDHYEDAAANGLDACISESNISNVAFSDAAACSGPTCGDNYCVSTISALKPEQNKQKLIIYCEGEKNLEEVDRDLLAVFCENVSVAWQNQLNAQ